MRRIDGQISTKKIENVFSDRMISKEQYLSKSGSYKREINQDHQKSNSS